MRLSFLSLAAVSVLLAATPAHAQDAAGILAKHFEATGGAKLWVGVTTSKKATTASMSGMEMSQTETIKYGAAARQDLTLMGSEGYMVVTPAKSVWMMPMMGMDKPQEMPAEMAKGMTGMYATPNPLLAVDASSATYKGTEKIGGRKCLKVEVAGDGAAAGTYYFDEATYMLLRRTGTQEAMGQKVDFTDVYSDFKKTAYGIIVPMSVERSSPSVPGGSGVTKITSMEYNVPLDEKLFSTDI